MFSRRCIPLIFLISLLLLISISSAATWTASYGGCSINLSCSNPAYNGNGYLGREAYPVAMGSTTTCTVNSNTCSRVRFSIEDNSTYTYFYGTNPISFTWAGPQGKHAYVDIDDVGGNTVLGAAGGVIGAANVVASWTASPVSGDGYPPLNMRFADTSTGSPTSWLWDFGDGNTTSNTTQSPYHYYSSAGSYQVKLKASKTGSTSWYNQTYVVTAYSAPSCSFTSNVTSGISPMAVLFTDTSSNVPTSYFWQFNPDSMGWLTVTPSETNTSRNSTVVFTGSGDLRVYHDVTNPAGTSVCGYQVLTLNGPAPSPTPTPNIPFPNQTGVCQGSQITLGSGLTYPFDSYYTLDMPNGNGLDGYYPNGVVHYTSGNTNQIGQYFYNEYNLTGSLIYRSSYITESCILLNTPAITRYPTPSITVTYPTVTGTIAINGTPVIPMVQTYAPIPTTVFNQNVSINSSDIKAKLHNWTSATDVYTDTVDLFISSVFTVLSFVFVVLSPLMYIANTFAYIIDLNHQYMVSYSTPALLMYHTIQGLSTAIHPKIQFVWMFGMTCDILLLLWSLKRGKRL